MVDRGGALARQPVLLVGEFEIEERPVGKPNAERVRGAAFPSSDLVVYEKQGGEDRGLALDILMQEESLAERRISITPARLRDETAERGPGVEEAEGPISLHVPGIDHVGGPGVEPLQPDVAAR